MSIARAISEQIQLVAQSNDYDYIKKADINEPIFGSLFKKLRIGAPAKQVMRESKTAPSRETVSLWHGILRRSILRNATEYS